MTLPGTASGARWFVLTDGVVDRGDSIPVPGVSTLIVEDDESASRSLALILKRFGYDVEVAHTGRDALAKARTRTYDLVVLDLGLPDMPGTDLLAPMRSADPDTAVIVVTAYATTETAVRALNEGAAAYVTKPFNMDEVLAVLQSCAERQRLARENRELLARVEAAHRELQEATAQLVHREKLVALGELTAGVAHELNQPLNSLKLICQSALRYFDEADPKSLRDDLTEMLGLIREMAKIVDDMRIFSRRIDAVERRRVDVETIVRGALRFTEQQLRDHGITVVTDLADGLPCVEGDAPRLQQVLLNLLSNARHAVEGSDRPEKRIVLRTYVRERTGDSPAVVIEIEDNGVGIPQDFLPKVFLPFVTTRRPGTGTGLGLSIAQRIMQEHDGRIEVESQVGVGTVLRLIIPAEGTSPPRPTP